MASVGFARKQKLAPQDGDGRVGNGGWSGNLKRSAPHRASSINSIEHRTGHLIIIDFILDAIGYTTARITLPLITFGKVQVEPISSTETGFNWWGFKRMSGGAMLCQAPMAAWIGLIPWVLAIALLITIA